jgi:hypothetical protein
VALPHGDLGNNLRGSLLLSQPEDTDDRLLAIAGALEPILKG